MTLDTSTPAAETLEYLKQPYGELIWLINAHAANQPERVALDDGEEQLTWGETAALVNRIAAQLQAEGLQKGQAVSILGTTTIRYALVYLGAIAAGGCAAPLTTSATPQQLAAMMTDSGAGHLFIDHIKRAQLADSGVALPALKHVMMDAPDESDSAPFLFDWMAPEGATPVEGTLNVPDQTPDEYGHIRLGGIGSIVAAEIGMEHNLGLTCDPVAGQVQVPCIERNAIASVKAINAARMALRRTSEPRVSLDKVIETMYETGKDMNAKYRETSRGGLAIKVQCD